MGLYEGIKDAAKIVQKADNIELYQKLLDLSGQALDLQNENYKLNKEIIRLHERENIESRIIRHKETYVTLDQDDYKTMYCSVCWDSNKKLIQLKLDDGGYICTVCRNHGIYDYEEHNRYMKSLANLNDNII